MIDDNFLMAVSEATRVPSSHSKPIIHEGQHQFLWEHNHRHVVSKFRRGNQSQPTLPGTTPVISTNIQHYGVENPPRGHEDRSKLKTKEHHQHGQVKTSHHRGNHNMIVELLNGNSMGIVFHGLEGVITTTIYHKNYHEF